MKNRKNLGCMIKEPSNAERGRNSISWYCDELGPEGIESVWRVRGVRGGRGEHGTDSAGAGEVRFISIAKAVTA